MRTRATCLVVACTALCSPSVLAGCGGANFRDGVYADEHVRYRVGPLDSQWNRVEIEGDDLAFRRDGMGSISVNSTCTNYEDVPTAALLNHLLFDTAQREFILEETVTLDGRGARHVVVHLELDGVPLEVEIFVMKKDGCVFDLAHVRSFTTPPAARSAFLDLVAKFSVLEVRSDD